MEKKEIIYGRNPVLEYIKQLSDPAGVELFISNSAHGKIIETIAGESKRKKITVQFCGKDQLSRYHSSSKHQGVVLLIPLKKGHISDLEFIESVGRKEGLLVLLDQLTDPHNVGSIIRTTEALGGDGLVIQKSHSADITGAVVKTSAGATAHLRILSVSNVASFLETAKKSGFWIIGSDGDGDSDISRLRALKPAVIVIGSEGAGMRRLTREKCDYVVNIPLRGKISSLNASVAAGILIFELLRD